MREFLSSLDLWAIEWEQAVHATGKANPYIGEILDAGFDMAHVALVRRSTCGTHDRSAHQESI
jgi:hypothetical protein